MEQILATSLAFLPALLCPVGAALLLLRSLPPRHTKGIPALMKLKGAAGTWREPVRAS
jgi:hypothetical protein